MTRIKSFNENWKDIFKPKRKLSLKEKKENFLKEFKKDYNQRTLSESILVDALLKTEGYGSTNNRYFGAMEAILLLEGFLKPGQDFDYKNKEEKLFFMNIDSKESYGEHMTRITKEYLKSKGVL